MQMSMPASLQYRPDGELHEPRKYLRKGAVELASIDPLCHQVNDIGAAARPVVRSLGKDEALRRLKSGLVSARANT